MKINQKCKMIAILLAIIMTIACKKEKPVVEKPVIEKTPEVLIPEEEAGGEDGGGDDGGGEDGGEKEVDTIKYLPAQLLNSNLKITFTYTDTILSKVEYTNGKSMVLIFNTKHQPEALEVYSDTQQTNFSEYTVNADNLITKITQYKIVRPSTQFTGYSTLEYNSKNQLITIKSFNPGNQLINEKTRTYDDAGNMSTEKSTSPGQTITYNYDTKNALFKNAGFAYLFLLESNDPIFLSAVNNLQKVSGAALATDNINYDYMYSETNYPSTIKLMYNGSLTSSYEVMYK